MEKQNKQSPIEELLKITNFSKQELEILARNFNYLSPVNEKVDKSHFRDLLCDHFGIDDSLLMDRGTGVYCFRSTFILVSFVFWVFVGLLFLWLMINDWYSFLGVVICLWNFLVCCCFHIIWIGESVVFRCFDTDADNYISYDEFMKGMSVFLKGKFEEQMKFCFRVFDLNGDRYISKEEMFQMLKNCLVKGSEEDEDGVKDLVDLVLKKLDEDRDGRVSEQDYIAAVTKENLLLEAFGQCLPIPKAVQSYLDPDKIPAPINPSASPYSNALQSAQVSAAVSARSGSPIDRKMTGTGKKESTGKQTEVIGMIGKRSGKTAVA